MASQVHPYAASARMTPSSSLNGSQPSVNTANLPASSSSNGGGGGGLYPSAALSRNGSSSGFSASGMFGGGGGGSGGGSPGPGPSTPGGSPYPGGARPAFDRAPSSTFGAGAGMGLMGGAGTGSGDSTPVATNSALNKTASASSSIYQRCTALRERLYRVPDFRDRFVEDTEQSLAAIASTSTSAAPPAAFGSTAPDSPMQTDPVSQVLSVLRLGASLCFVFNRLGHAHQLDVNPQATLSNLKACQRGAAHFIMACKQDLQWPEQDLFAVSELYGQDTNGVVKVVHTVTKLLDLLESQGALLPPSEDPHTVAPQPGPSDERSLVVREILDSERKYMQDLEVLQDYQRQLQTSDVLTQDQIHSLFINLNKLADFQRRFLIGVESNASLPAEQQRFGNLFLQMEDNFACYEPYCANLTNAQDLAIAENAALSKLSHVLDPVSELAPLLIKPVQRICKYPLLISQLLKNTPDTFPYYDELKAGLESVMRVTDKVNEEKRRQDNAQAVTDLAHRVEDWKGHDLSSFGQLLLHENFVVIKSDNEREYSVYLFERIILCCKEVVAQGKKDKKSNSILKRPPSQRINKLQLKGRIFVNNVTAASPLQSRNGQYLLEVRWRGDVGEEAFTIKCRTEELLRQWQKAITRAVEEAPLRRRHHLSASRRSDRGGVHSPASQFPPTPMSETGPQLPSPYPQSDHSAYPSPNYPPGSYNYANPAQPGYPPGHYASGQYGFDDDGQDDHSDMGTSESGRATPGGGSTARRGPSTRSLPAGDPNGGAHSGTLRPRAHTEDASSHVMSQWRTQPPPPGSAPPLRGMSTNSSNGDAQSLRSSASSRQLRSAPSAEWGGPGPAGGSLSSSPAMSYARLPTAGSPAPYPSGDADSGYGGGVSRLPPGASHGGGGGGSTSMSRQGSYGTVSGPSSQAPSMYRSRSGSSPHLYHQPQRGYTGDSTTQTPDDSYRKRESDSSHGTDRSSASNTGGGGGRRGALSSATSSATSFPSPASSAPHIAAGPAAANAVRVKVLFGEDTFVVVVLDSCTYAELVDKVLKKVRMCGAANARVEAPALRLRYRDEDGDRISITSEEDVAMAFETARAIASEKGPGAQLELVLYAAVDSPSL
ncbi:hypothetical protein JCM10908_007375 [Rhodotorula pacifica]|uniref:uncharacterized protein n=1 Tax=Rhodotorula pacifica TaxID=1495444 RepID=UPI00316FFB89